LAIVELERPAAGVAAEVNLSPVIPGLQSARYMMGIENSAPARIPVGQREVTVLRRV
jgi:hypothetical protein